MENNRNLSTGYISPQFHLVFDDLFDMVVCTKYGDNAFNHICNYLFNLNRDWYAEDYYDDNGKIIYQPPSLEDVWIYEQGRCNRRHELENKCRRRMDCIHGRIARYLMLFL